MTLPVGGDAYCRHDREGGRNPLQFRLIEALRPEHQGKREKEGG